MLSAHGSLPDFREVPVRRTHGSFLSSHRLSGRPVTVHARRRGRLVARTRCRRTHGSRDADGETVTLARFGTFPTKTRPDRQGRNSRTGESIACERQHSHPPRLRYAFDDDKAGPTKPNPCTTEVVAITTNPCRTSASAGPFAMPSTSSRARSQMCIPTVGVTEGAMTDFPVDSLINGTATTTRPAAPPLTPCRLRIPARKTASAALPARRPSRR